MGGNRNKKRPTDIIGQRGSARWKACVPLTQPLKVELSLDTDVKYENKLLLRYLNQQTIHKEHDSISCFLQKAKKQVALTYRENRDTHIQYTAREHRLHLKVITMCVCINTWLKHVVS